MYYVLNTSALIIFIFISSSSCFIQKQVRDNPQSPWCTFQHDLKHTGRSPFEGPDKPDLKWKYGAGDNINAHPTISADETIYFGSDDYKLYAINSDGTLRWSFEGEKAIRSAPVIGNDGTIYVGSRDGYLYALLPDGSLKWKFKTDG